MKIYAFADEASANIDKQIKAMKENRLDGLEIRNVDSVNIAEISDSKAKEVRKKLDNACLRVWTIGSPIGKIDIEKDDFALHTEKFKRTLELADILGAENIRLFSFFTPSENRDSYKDKVIERLGTFCEIAKGSGITLCHENEKGIYGDTPERCLEILNEFDGRLGCVFDPANFIQCGCEPFEYSYNLLKTHITYLHIKDALKNGTVVPAGMGVGSIPELLAVINRVHKGDFILTIEPHLRVFSGLENLEEAGHTSTVANAYPTAAAAFKAAVENLRYCIPRTAEIG